MSKLTTVSKPPIKPIGGTVIKTLIPLGVLVCLFFSSIATGAKTDPAPVAPVVKSTATPAPMAYVAMRLHMRAALHAKGYGIVQVNKMVAGLDNDTIDTVAQAIPSGTDTAYTLLAKVGTEQVATKTAQPPPLLAAGGFFTTLLADITAFLATPAGQTLEQALLQLVLALIAGA